MLLQCQRYSIALKPLKYLDLESWLFTASVLARAPGMMPALCL